MPLKFKNMDIYKFIDVNKRYCGRSGMKITSSAIGNLHYRLRLVPYLALIFVSNHADAQTQNLMTGRLDVA